MELPARSRLEQLSAAVHVWMLFPETLGGSPGDARWLPWLAPAELAHGEKFATDRLRHTYLATRALCRATLSRYAGVDPQAWRFRKRKEGKPVIAQPAEFSRLRFNLTHTDALVACAITCAEEVGVDAEDAMRAVNIDEVIRESLSQAEKERLSALAPRQRRDRFFELWVLKEAYFKGRGTGLLRPMDRLTIALDARDQPLPVGNWRFFLHRPSARHIAATAVRLPKGRGAISVGWFEMDSEQFGGGLPVA